MTSLVVVKRARRLAGCQRIASRPPGVRRKVAEIGGRTDARDWEALVTYGFLATMRTKPGHRDDVVKILLSGVAGLREAGCRLYVVGVSDTDADKIWVNEVWESKAHHDASLLLPETRAAIALARPRLTGEFTGQELTVAGGLM
jgi:quinol monooxygenase YgiN